MAWQPLAIQHTWTGLRRRCVPAADPEQDLIVVERPVDLGDSDRHAVHALLSEAFPEAFASHAPGDEPIWTQQRPLTRFVVIRRTKARPRPDAPPSLAAGELAGNIGLVDVSIRGGPTVVGLSDLVVSPELRGFGLATKLIDAALFAADKRNPDIVMVASESPAVIGILRGRGFEPTKHAYYQHDGERRTNPAWRLRAAPCRTVANDFEISGDF